MSELFTLTMNDCYDVHVCIPWMLQSNELIRDLSSSNKSSSNSPGFGVRGYGFGVLGFGVWGSH
jgi:hypothetical protein